MQPFDRNDERLRAYLAALWGALVPDKGECASVQGELVRASGRLSNEHYRNGLANYYTPDEDDHGFADGYYPSLLLFIADTITAEANSANDEETKAWLREVRTRAPRDWDLQRRIDAIIHRAEDEERELTDEENAEIERLEEGPDRIAWEDLLDRLEIAVANYCIGNPLLVDRRGYAVEEGGVSDIRHVFDPPPPPPPCPLCGGKGWLAPTDPAQFPTMCSCKTPQVLH